MNLDLPIASTMESVSTPENEREIGALVDQFYQRIRNDEVLGPIFNSGVQDWDAHLAKMRDFWSAAMYRTGRYAGRPLAAHRQLPDIRAEHFPRWIALWEETVDEVVKSDANSTLKEIATRMAANMAPRI